MRPRSNTQAGQLPIVRLYPLHAFTVIATPLRRSPGASGARIGWLSSSRRRGPGWRVIVGACITRGRQGIASSVTG